MVEVRPAVLGRPGTSPGETPWIVRRVKPADSSELSGTSATKETSAALETSETDQEEQEEGTGRSAWKAEELLAAGAWGVLHVRRCDSRDLGSATRQQHFAAVVEAAAAVAAAARFVGAESVYIVAPQAGAVE